MNETATTRATYSGYDITLGNAVETRGPEPARWTLNEPGAFWTCPWCDYQGYVTWDHTKRGGVRLEGFWCTHCGLTWDMPQ